MMGWAAVLLACLKLLATLSDYLSRRQLLEAGQARAMAAGLESIMDNLNKARRAADAVEHPASAADDDYAKRLRERYTRPDG
jgi:hypothetical protein